MFCRTGTDLIWFGDATLVGGEVGEIQVSKKMSLARELAGSDVSVCDDPDKIVF